MRLFLCFFITCYSLLFFTPFLLGQGSTDSITYTLSDTIFAAQYFEEMKVAIKNRDWEEAEIKGEQAKVIYEQVLGEVSEEMADLYFNLGLIDYYQNKYQEAILDWTKRLEIAMKFTPNNRKLIASSMSNLGVCYELIRSYDEAAYFKLECLKTRIKIHGEIHEDVATSYNSLGNLFSSKNEHEKAIAYKDTSLSIRLLLYGAVHQDIVGSYISIAKSYGLKGDCITAIEFQEKALQVQNLLDDRDSLFLSKIYHDIGTSHYKCSNYILANEYYNKSLSFFGENENAFELALTYNNIGGINEEIGNLREALFYYEKSLNIRRVELGDLSDQVANSYLNIGNVYQEIGDYDKSKNYYTEALRIFISLYGDTSNEAASCYNNIGILLSKMDDNKAVDYYNKALHIRKQILSKDDIDIAHVYNNLSLFHYSNNNLKLAIEYQLKSLDIFRGFYGDNHLYVARSSDNLGLFEVRENNLEKALSFHTDAIKIFKTLFGDEHPDLADALMNLGDAFLLEKNYSHADSCYHQSLIAAGYEEGKMKYFSLNNILSGLERIASINLYLYNKSKERIYLDSAYSYVLKSLAALDYQQSTLTEEGSKNFWQSENYPVYEQAISINLLKAKVDADQALYEQTFTYAEKSKAARLQAQMKAADALAFANLPDSLLTKERDLRIDITWREKQRQQLLEEEKTETDTTVLRIGSIVFDLRQQYDSLKVHLEKEYPEYFRAKYDLSTVDLAYAQDSLIEADQSLVEYFVGDSSLFLFLVQKDHFEVKEIKKDTAFEDWITDMTQAGIYGYYNAPVAAQSRRSYARSLKAYSVAASKLYETLIAPVKDQLTEKVIIVPDGVLGYLPFEALLTEEPREYDDLSAYSYLLYDHQISYSYSATLLKEMRERKHRVPAQQELLAFAPFFNGRSDTLIAQIDTTVLGSALVLKDSLGTLPLSGEETKSITQMLGGEPYYGSAATIELFRELAPLYRILHLSTHAEADDRVGDYAYLAFGWPDDAGKFTKLYARDLYNISLNADMVVLSACETGRGKLRRGEGIVSLARAFAYAGAKSIFTTLWKVEEQATKDVVLFFYKYLQMGHSKDRALHLAKLEYLDQNKEDIRLQHPFFWASMIGIGDMNSL